MGAELRATLFKSALIITILGLMSFIIHQRTAQPWTRNEEKNEY